MKKFWLFVVFCNVLCKAAQAAPVPKPFAHPAGGIIPTTPVIALHKATAPLSSHGLQPKGSTLLRCATAPAGEDGKAVWLFFYGSRPRSLTSKPFNVSDQAVIVNLKVAERKKQGKNWVWTTLRSIPLGYCEEYMWQDCKLLWMKPAAKTGPIVLVPRIEGDELIAFPDGWNQKKAVRQSFGRMASSLAAISYQFDAVDEKGIFMVTEERSERTEDGSDNSYTFLKWNGKEWKLKE
jgi:hypothetical protein